MMMHTNSTGSRKAQNNLLHSPSSKSVYFDTITLNRSKRRFTRTLRCVASLKDVLVVRNPPFKSLLQGLYFSTTWQDTKRDESSYFPLQNHQQDLVSACKAMPRCWRHLGEVG